MSNSCYPYHIHQIISGIKSDKSPEQVLIQWEDFINKDSMLYDLYDKLTYDPVSRKFAVPPAASYVIYLLKYLYNSKGYDTTSSKCSLEEHLQIDESSSKTTWPRD